MESYVLRFLTSPN